MLYFESNDLVVAFNSIETTGINLINILHVPFAPIFLLPKIAKPNVIRERLINLLLYEKHSDLLSQYFLRKKFQSEIVSKEKLREALFY